MAEENKILPTKLNPDESEMEMQTEAQIALKAQQDQELRSIEMEIRELENKMKQRQIPFTSLLERNQFDELDIRDDPNVSHDQKVFDLEERLRSTKLTYEEGRRMKTIENNASMNQDSSNAPLRDKYLYGQPESDKPNNSSNKFGELGVLANHAPESVLDEQTQISLVNKILGNNPQIVRTELCNSQGKIKPELQQEFDREITTVNAFIERAIHCTTNPKSKALLLNTLVSPNGQEHILNIINSKANSWTEEFRSLEEVPTQVIYEHLKEYINARANKINTSETDTERVQKLASTTVNLISNLTINSEDPNCLLETETQLNAIYAQFFRDQTFYNRAFPHDFNPEWAAKTIDLLKRARHGSILNSFYSEKSNMDNNDPNLTMGSEASMTFLQERYTVTRFLSQLREWFKDRVSAMLRVQCFNQSVPSQRGSGEMSNPSKGNKDKRKAKDLNRKDSNPSGKPVGS